MKNTILAVLTTAFVMSAAVVGAAEDGVRFQWPQGQKAAVSLGYDDALNSQLDNVIPALDKAGLKGSFYLQLSNPAVGKRIDEWRAAARNGHELGNHSLFHQCSGRKAEWVKPQRDLDSTSIAQMQDQLALANTMLYAIDGKRERTFTVPCGNTQAGDGDYLPAVAPLFVGIKNGGKVLLPAGKDALRGIPVDAYTPHGLSGKQLIAMVEKAAARGRLVTFTFHGVGGDHLATSNAAHDELVQYLADHKQDYWTDTFLNIMTYVKQQDRGDH